MAGVNDKALSFGALHPSSLNAWVECPKQFEYTTVLRQPPEYRHPASLNGTAIHRVLDEIHTRGLWDAKRDDLIQLYAEGFEWAIKNPKNELERDVPIMWGKLLGEAGAREKFMGDAVSMVDGYRRDPRNRDAAVLATHGRWRAWVGGFLWEGELDQARDLGDGTAELIDWKSSAKPIHKTVLEMWPQGLTYALAMEHAEFIADGEEEWRPLELSVSRATWVHLRDYVPYLRAGTRSDGTRYLAGDARGPAFRSMEVTPQKIASHVKEMALFAAAVASGRFERRREDIACSRCKVAAVCMRDFCGGEIKVTTEVADEDYD